MVGVTCGRVVRFWLVQGVESGIFLALALALTIFTYWSVTTRET